MEPIPIGFFLQDRLLLTLVAFDDSRLTRFLEIINESFGNLKDRDLKETTLLSEENTNVLPLETSADYMNSFFCSISNSDVSDKEISNRYCDYVSTDDETLLCNEFMFIEVNERSVKKFVDKIDIHKSSSIDHMNCRHQQLFAHLKHYNLLSGRQHGLTSGRSTATAIQDFMLLVCNNINCAVVPLLTCPKLMTP